MMTMMSTKRREEDLWNCQPSKTLAVWLGLHFDLDLSNGVDLFGFKKGIFQERIFLLQNIGISWLVYCFGQRMI